MFESLTNQSRLLDGLHPPPEANQTMTEQKIEQPKVSHICLSSEHNAVSTAAFTQATCSQTSSYQQPPCHWIIQSLSDTTLGKWLSSGYPCQ